MICVHHVFEGRTLHGSSRLLFTNANGRLKGLQVFNSMVLTSFYVSLYLLLRILGKANLSQGWVSRPSYRSRGHYESVTARLHGDR